MRWRVERAGSPGAWLTGWIAHIPELGYGARYDTWAEAMGFALAECGRVTEPCS